LLQKIKAIKPASNNPSLTEIFFPGLVIHTYLILLLKCIGLPWLYTSLITIIFSITPLSYTLETLNRLRLQRFSLNFALWFFIVLALGISVLDTTKAFETYWVNAYGDQAFHMGMISSFTFGENFPPQNHLLPGELLSYPFLVNVWAASLWWPNPNLKTLSFVFLFQWLCIWIPVYFLFKGNKITLLPWVILFAGGSLAHLGQHSAKGIAQSYPWSVFLTTIWVPQRSALFGLLGISTLISAFHRYQLDPSKEFYLLWCGLLAALMPLVHTHMLLVSAAYIGLVIVFVFHKKCLRPLVIFVAPALFSLHALYWLLGKESIFSFAVGWYPWTNSTDLLSRLAGSIKMWIFNGGHVLIVVIALLISGYFQKKSAALKNQESITANLCAISTLFILGNFFIIAIWEWDQIKIFASIFLQLILLYAHAYETPDRLRLHLLLLILMIPAFAEMSLILRENRSYTVYSQDDWSKAQEIVKETDPSAIILGSPDHNSLITLTGRRIFLGFPGTLHSHGSKYQDREIILTSLTQAVNCSLQFAFKERKELCPTHLLWAHNEIKKWGVIDKKSALRLEPTNLSYLYRIKD
jgi:hypothetical protein